MNSTTNNVLQRMAYYSTQKAIKTLEHALPLLKDNAFFTAKLHQSLASLRAELFIDELQTQN
jgi:hypothetical protein